MLQIDDISSLYSDSSTSGPNKAIVLTRVGFILSVQ